MNLNHNPDAHLLEQIDKRLNTQQPSGISVVDELADTVPVPREAFQQALEARLLAKMETLPEGETIMTTKSVYVPIRSARRGWLPLTLLAAMLVIVIAVGIILVGSRPAPSEVSLAQQNMTATATRVIVTVVPPAPAQNLRLPGVGGVLPVVVAIRDIPQGTVLSSQWLMTTYWGGTDTTQLYSDPELLRGMVAKHDIPRWQPILASDVGDEPMPASSALPASLPIDRTAIEVPLALLAEDSLKPKVGDSVDILALLPFSGSPSNIADIPATALPDGTRLVEKFVVFDALVITQYISPNTTEPSTNVFSLPPDEGRLLAWLVEQGITLRLQAPMNNDLPNLGDSRVVKLPIENVTAVEPIQVGDEVVIYSTCAFDTDGTVDCSQTANVSQSPATVIIGEVAGEGQPLSVNSTFIGVAVAPDVFEHLNALNSLGMHFKLLKAGEAENRILVPDGKVAISVPMSSLKLLEGDNFAVGDTVDVIVTYKIVDVGDAPSEFQQVITPEADAIDQITQRLAKGTLIVGISDTPVSNITLAVTTQEAGVLQWVIDSKLPINLLPYAADTNPTSPYTLQLSLDALAHWTTNALTVGDRVDLVMGFVLGDGEQVTMNFQPYDVYTWGDEISEGTVSAQIFAPMNDTPFGPAFLRRVIHGAVITSMRVSKDATTGRLSDVLVVLELPAGTSSQSLDEVTGFIEAGMPYLLLKP